MIALWRKSLIALFLISAGTIRRGPGHRIIVTGPVKPALTLPAPLANAGVSLSSPIQEPGDLSSHLFIDNHSNARDFSFFRREKTPFSTESRVPIVPLFQSRVQLGFFITSVDNRSIMSGPIAPRGASSRPGAAALRRFLWSRRECPAGKGFRIEELQHLVPRTIAHSAKKMRGVGGRYS